MKRINLVIILVFVALVSVPVSITYARFSKSYELSGSIVVPESNFCINNGFTALADCILASSITASSIDTSIAEAKAVIESKIADLSSTEPVAVYKQVVTTGYTSKVSAPSSYYWSTVAPTLNSSTGYYTWSSSYAKFGSVSDYLSDDNTKYYTCLNQSSSGYCTTVYVVYSFESNYITLSDRYTQSLSETATASPGLYAAVDENDTISYYFRGNVTNNYVSYAGFIWRVVRINGDGSIRLIYSGTSSSATGSNTSIGTAAFNTNVRDMTFVGYTYGLNQTLKTTTNTLTYTNITSSTSYYYSDAYECTDSTSTCKLTGNMISGTWSSMYSEVLNGNSDNNNTPYQYTCWSTSATGTCSVLSQIVGTVTTSGSINGTQARVKYIAYLSSSYEDTYGTISSNVKSKIDTWYQTNILNKSDSDGNSYATYLADATFCNDKSIASDSEVKTGDTLEGHTFYGPRYRVYSTKTATFVCPQDEDKYTVASGKLTYPVALLTIDEVSLAGGKYASLNSQYYLYTGQTYWTMSPSGFYSNSASANVWDVNSAGTLNSTWVTASYGVRPVLNLSSDILFTEGDGTADHPYVVALGEGG